MEASPSPGLCGGLSEEEEDSGKSVESPFDGDGSAASPADSCGGDSGFSGGGSPASPPARSPEEGRFRCFFCPSSFPNRTKQQQHLRVHSHRAPFACGHCDRRFATCGALEQHVAVHGRLYHCAQCDTRFASARLLHAHAASHTPGASPSAPQGARARLLFKCSVCSGKFLRAGELSRHVMFHTGERRHLCVHCQDAFLKESHLTQHRCPRYAAVKRRSARAPAGKVRTSDGQDSSKPSPLPADVEGTEATSSPSSPGTDEVDASSITPKSGAAGKAAPISERSGDSQCDADKPSTDGGDPCEGPSETPAEVPSSPTVGDEVDGASPSDSKQTAAEEKRAKKRSSEEKPTAARGTSRGRSARETSEESPTKKRCGGSEERAKPGSSDTSRGRASTSKQHPGEEKKRRGEDTAGEPGEKRRQPDGKETQMATVGNRSASSDAKPSPRKKRSRSKYHHGAAGLFKCDVCNFKFEHEYRLQRHVSIHTGEKPFECVPCNRSFRLVYGYKKHCRCEMHLNKVREWNEKNQPVAAKEPKRNPELQKSKDVEPGKAKLCAKTLVSPKCDAPSVQKRRERQEQVTCQEEDEVSEEPLQSGSSRGDRSRKRNLDETVEILDKCVPGKQASPGGETDVHVQPLAVPPSEDVPCEDSPSPCDRDLSFHAPEASHGQGDGSESSTLEGSSTSQLPQALVPEATTLKAEQPSSDEDDGSWESALSSPRAEEESSPKCQGVEDAERGSPVARDPPPDGCAALSEEPSEPTEGLADVPSPGGGETSQAAELEDDEGLASGAQSCPAAEESNHSEPCFGDPELAPAEEEAPVGGDGQAYQLYEELEDEGEPPSRTGGYAAVPSSGRSDDSQAEDLEDGDSVASGAPSCPAGAGERGCDPPAGTIAAPTEPELDTPGAVPAINT